MFRSFSPTRTSSGHTGSGGLPVDSAGGSSHWNGHGGSDGWHSDNWHGGNGHGGDWHGGHDDHWSHDHNDHWHGSWYPYHYYPYYNYGYSSWWGWPCSGLSIGFSYGSYCWPYSSYLTSYPYWGGGYTYYNPVSYAMSYPAYSPMDYGTTINNYYTGSEVSGVTGMGSMPGPVYVDNGYKPQPPQAAADDAATVYRSAANHGPMAWSDTATSIVNAMVGAPADQRASVAKRFLGRTPSGAWEATFEGRQDIENATELTCRGTGVTTAGGRPTIVVRVNHKVDALTPGQRLSVTGRLVEVSVDDSSNPGGVLVLEDSDVSW